MPFTRRQTDKDATWQRAWTADAISDLANIPNPRRGDLAYVTTEARHYQWFDNNTWIPILNSAANENIPGVWNFVNGLKERNRSALVGIWTSIAYNAANFSGNGSMVWTVTVGNQIGYAYTLIGNTLFVSWQIANSVISGTPNTDLQIAVPFGLSAASFSLNYVSNNDASGAYVGFAYVGFGSTTIGIRRDNNSSAWAAGGNVWTQGSIIFPVILP